MPQSTVTFVSHEARPIQTKRGPAVINEFETADGFKVQAPSWAPKQAAAATRLLTLLGQPVQVSYEEQVNGTFTNYNLVGVEPANGNAAAGNLPASAAAGAAPVTAPAPNLAKQETEQRITRSFAVNAALKALEIATASGSYAPSQDGDPAEEILKKAVELAHIPAVFAYSGPQKSSPPEKAAAVGAAAATSPEELGIPSAAPKI